MARATRLTSNIKIWDYSDVAKLAKELKIKALPRRMVR